MILDDLRKIMPYTAGHLDIFAQPLLEAMSEFEINTGRRRSAFIAQVAHESGELRYLREIGSGQAYEGRADLGNTEPGDGPLYKGGGLLQITGRANYSACGTALDVPLVGNPSLIETPAIACRSAGWFWKTKGLNAAADLDYFGQITKTINGGFNGLDNRLQYWLRARKTEGL